MSKSDIALLQKLRGLIDKIDDFILYALSERFQAIELLRELKQAKDMRIADPRRERELKARWKKRAKELKVPEALALLMLDFILVESKRMQES